MSILMSCVFPRLGFPAAPIDCRNFNSAAWGIGILSSMAIAVQISRYSASETFLDYNLLHPPRNATSRIAPLGPWRPWQLRKTCHRVNSAVMHTLLRSVGCIELLCQGYFGPCQPIVPLPINRRPPSDTKDKTQEQHPQEGHPKDKWP